MARAARPKLTCRPFEYEEWQLYRDLRLEALKAHPNFFSSTYAKEKTFKESDWCARVQSADCVVFGLFANDEAIGCVGIYAPKETPDSPHLWGTYLKPEYRGLGLSGPLYQTLIAYAQSRKDWARIVVSHRKLNAASGAASKLNGFQYTHTESTAWPDGKTEDQLFYELKLQR